MADQRSICPDCGWEASGAEMARHMEDHVAIQSGPEASGLERGWPLAGQIPVFVAPQNHVPGGPWHDIHGRTYVPGDVIENGNIVGHMPGILVASGTVTIALGKLTEALASGWMLHRTVNAALVQVTRHA